MDVDEDKGEDEELEDVDNDVVIQTAVLSAIFFQTKREIEWNSASRKKDQLCSAI